MVAVSSISAMKVDTPFNWLSPAPTLHRMESKIGSLASAQGTKHPICDIKAITPIYHSRVSNTTEDNVKKTLTWRIYVDFPPMFGPAWRKEVSGCAGRWKVGEELTDDLKFTFFCSKSEQGLMYFWRTRTFNHFDVVWNEIDPILHFQAGVPRFFQNKVAWT